MKRWGMLFLLVCAGSAHAAESPELPQLKLLLDVLNGEQQAVIEQMRMTQEIRRSNFPCGGRSVPPGMVDYEEWADAQRSALQRENELRGRIDRLHSRWDDLEARKQPLLQRIYQFAEPAGE